MNSFLLLLITNLTQSVRKPLVCGIVALLVAIAIVPSLQPASFAQNETTSGSQGVKTSTELKTYTDPDGFFTLQYPPNWTTKYEPSVSKFDEARTWLFVDGKLFAPLNIRVSTAPGTQKDLEDNFDFVVSLLKQRGYDILQSKFGLYKIDGQDAGGIQFQTPSQEKVYKFPLCFMGN
jgi:hypothetical protein